MRSTELHTIAGTRLSQNSPAQRLIFSAQSRKSQRNLILPLSPPSVQSISTQSLYQSKRIRRTYCFSESGDLPFNTSTTSLDHNNLDLDPQKNQPATGLDCNLSTPQARVLRNVAWIGVATAISKILGLLREIILAAVFGIGMLRYFPVFLHHFWEFIMNIHLKLSHVVNDSYMGSKLSMERGRKLVKNTKAVMFLIGGALGALAFLFAESIIHLSAPGAEGDNVIPCISPALSSISIIASCVTYVSVRGVDTSNHGDGLLGAILISCGASLGSLLQCVIQVIMQKKTGYSSILISWMNILKDKDVHEFFSLMIPATLSSGLAQIAYFTDLYFSSFIPGAAAGLSYAHLLVMAPLGILSSIIVLPLLPTFSRLVKTSSWPSLMESLRREVLLCMVIVLPILSTMCVLANPIISVLFQRFKFDHAASALVSSLLLCYSIGSPFYIIRELLVMVFYALGDGEQPFLTSVAAIVLNAVLDWLFVSRLCLGAQGLALSTSLVTALSVLVLFHLLLKKLAACDAGHCAGLVDFMTLVSPLLLLFSCCIFSGFTTSVAYKTLQHPLSSVMILRFGRLSELLSISLAGSLGMIGFVFQLAFLHCAGFHQVKDLYKTLATS
ncbi:hypothetical protein HHK36_015654 [Tetracentron sinense]|uniref:Uncharacterized protein n=1 Tax=Tetracentron sinense TaxID=13715 RepID=A0A835DGZ9_TETSI|nr:hypothetical protein HHK36_015654 [Tetracentron sinense]